MAMAVRVLLRECTIDDLELLLAWRNQPLVWMGFYTQSKTNKPISWVEHCQWWYKTQDWKRWIVQVDDGRIRDVGWVAIRDLYSWEPEMSLGVGEVLLWGTGVGRDALALALNWLREQGYKYSRTSILDNNERAKRLYLVAGYEKIAGARPGESLYRAEI